MIENFDLIINAADIERVLEYYNHTLSRRGRMVHTDCPFCHKETTNKKPAFQIFNKKNNVSGKCFYCDNGANAYNLVKHFEKTDDAQVIVEKIAEIQNIQLTKKEKKQVAKVQFSKPTSTELSSNSKLFTSTTTIYPGSFAEKQLHDSGLTVDDITSEVIEVIGGVETRKTIKRIVSATKNGREIVVGDDALFAYVGLDRKYSTYQILNKTGVAVGKPLQLWRTRYQSPELHLDKNGKPMKYASPYKSGCHLWWSEVMLKTFEQGRVCDTLHIQEGEKKAEKCCKHGIMSVGIMGIHNIIENEQLHHEFAMFIKKCNVKNVVFTVDSDWDEIKYNAESKEYVDNRVRTFFTAVRKVKQYFHALVNAGIEVNVYFSYVKNKDTKGIDDLLMSEALIGKEHLLKEEYDRLLNEPKGTGEFVVTENITTISEAKLQQIFGIATREQFVERYIDVLKTYDKFNYNGTWQRINAETNQIELAQPLSPEEMFFYIVRNSKGNIDIQWKPHKFHKWLTNNGIGQYIISYQQSMVNECFVQCNAVNKTIKKVRTKDIRFHVLNTLKNIGEYEVYDYVVNNEKYVSDSTLNNIEYITDSVNIVESTSFSQNMYFNNCYWSISKDGILKRDLADLNGYIWEDQIKDFKPAIDDEPLVRFERIDNVNYKPIFNKNAKNAHILQFLINTSNEFKLFETLTPEQQQRINNNLINKLTAIGYLLHRHFNPSNAKIITAIDSNEAEDGESQGRTGKSLLIQIIKNFCRMWEIDGKKTDIETDKNVLGDTDENTWVISLDDIRKAFNIEWLFSKVTGNVKSRNMYTKEVVIPREKTPKWLVTTNHSIKGSLTSSSIKDRIFYVPFTNYYDENHKPINDFSMLFFDEWDFEQWNFYYQLIACSLQTYFEFGLVEGNVDVVKQKTMHHEIGDTIFNWFNSYIIDGKDSDNNRLNVELVKEDMIKKFEEDNRKYVSQYPMTPNKFKAKLKLWCQYHQYTFNPYKVKKDKQGNIISEHGGDHKTDGKEFITVSTKAFLERKKAQQDIEIDYNNPFL